jgi:plastocyanin
MAINRMSLSQLAILAVVVAFPASMARTTVAPQTHVVRLEANRFVPAESRVAPGDTVRFVNGQGGPHNVQFMAESIPATAQSLINDAMRERILPLTSPMFIIPDEVYTLVVPVLTPGRYAFLCSPHWANMRGSLTVVPREK